MGILVKEDDPLAQLDTIVPTELEGYALIVPDRQRIQNELAKWINWEERQVDIVASYNIGYNMIHLVQEGMGIAICLEAMGACREHASFHSGHSRNHFSDCL